MGVHPPKPHMEGHLQSHAGMVQHHFSICDDGAQRSQLWDSPTADVRVLTEDRNLSHIVLDLSDLYSF